MTWQQLSQFPNQKIVESKHEYWAIRDGKVYHQKRLLRHADSDTFEIWCTDDDYMEFIARDKNAVYYAWTKTKLDPMTLRPYHSWWLDKNGVYTEGETNLYPIKGADSDTFRYIGDSYAIDENRAYYFNRAIKTCQNPQALKVLDNLECYATDGVQIYLTGTPLKGANPKTWRILAIENEKNYSTDGERVYWLEHKLPFVKFDEWQYLAEDYSKGRKYVYHLAWVVKEQDPSQWDVQKAIAYAIEKEQQSKAYYEAMTKKFREAQQLPPCDKC